MLESGLGADDYIKLTFPEDLGNSASTYAFLLNSNDESLTKEATNSFG